MPFEIYTHAQQGSFSLLITCGLVLLTFVYCRGWLRIRRASPTFIPFWRLAAFMSGLFLVWIALGSPLAVLDHQLLTVHMMKHLLLMTAGAPLILLGAPSLPLQCGLPQYFMRRSQILSGKTTPLLGCFLSNSVFCWVAGAAAVIAWHIPVLFNLAMSSHTWHIVEDASFLSSGLLFWWPIIRYWSSDAKPLQWSMPLYLFLATLPCDILSAFLTFCDRVVYPGYVSAARVFNLSPLQDQECAGAVMWVCITFAYLIPAVVITMQILALDGIDRRRNAPGVLSRLELGKVSGVDIEIL
jgi:putative membrane protein